MSVRIGFVTLGEPLPDLDVAREKMRASAKAAAVAEILGITCVSI